MNLLVTAGNTLAPIDRVRGITNIFTGRTGANIAATAAGRGHRVTLFTSHPGVLKEMPHGEKVTIRQFRTFDDLAALMDSEIPGSSFDAIVHCAAISDYKCAGVWNSEYGPFDEDSLQLMKRIPDGKVKSHYREIWLQLQPTPKLVDRIRREYRFTGKLVKFKLEVDVSDEKLLQIAEASRLKSGADWMCANTLEGAAEWAYLGAVKYEKVSRAELANRLVEKIC